MGCDIHGYLEAKENNSWGVVEEIPHYRVYDMFGLLAGVRNYTCLPPISNPRGLPEDISNEVKKELEYWGLDAHSISWLSYEDFKNYDWSYFAIDGRVSQIDKVTGKVFCKAEYVNEDFVDKERFKLEHLKIIAQEVLDRNVEWREFIEHMGELTEEYGENNIRIVFWFDN